MNDKSQHIVEHLFRTEYGKLVSVLTRIFGTSYIQLAEDMVQETLISALNHWSTNNIPENPEGWLIQVAKRKVLNELKRNQMKERHHLENVASNFTSHEISTVFLQNEIEDNQLRMIFICCHSSLNKESQIALTLKTLCGFGVKEVSNALLTSESTINKRLYRAKEKIRKSNLTFDIPQGNELKNRLDTVCITLYLLFNEGYNSRSDNTIIKKDLCLEAIRLTKILANHFEKNKKICALLSLMCFHTARFDARIDNQGAIILFEDQDRKLWNTELISIGMHYLKQSMNDRELSSYHIEANIAAEHCLAKDFESTNWQNIYDLYELLGNFKPNAIIQLNLAIIQSKLNGIRHSLKILDQLSENKELINYHLLPATQGIFNMKIGNYQQAISFLIKAKKLKPSSTETQFITNKIVECEKLLSTS